MDRQKEGQIRYDSFIQVYNEAYSDIQKQTRLKNAQGLWKGIKNDPEKLRQKMCELKVKAAKKNCNNMSYWVKTVANSIPSTYKANDMPIVVSKEVIQAPSEISTKEAVERLVSEKASKETPVQDKLNHEILALQAELTSKKTLQNSGLAEINHVEVLQIKRQIRKKEAHLKKN